MAEPHVYDGVAEVVAEKFHETYERLAPEFGYETRRESARPWLDIPRANRQLMTAVVRSLMFEQHAIEVPFPGSPSPTAASEAAPSARARIKVMADLFDNDEDRVKLAALTRWAVPAGYAGGPAGSQVVVPMVRWQDVEDALRNVEQRACRVRVLLERIPAMSAESAARACSEVWDFIADYLAAKDES